MKVGIGLIFRAIGDHAHDHALGGYIPVNASNAFHLLDLAADAQCGYLKLERVAGNDGASKFSFFDTAEKRDLGIAVLELAQGQGRFTIFSVVDALTRLAGEYSNAGDRLQADQQAARLLELATV